MPSRLFHAVKLAALTAARVPCGVLLPASSPGPVAASHPAPHQLAQAQHAKQDLGAMTPEDPSAATESAAVASAWSSTLGRGFIRGVDPP
jgi:hypothetical protein